MFCFMELDLMSLMVSAVSNSRFWVVYGFSLSWEVLVLAVLNMSISTGLSKWPYQHIFTVTIPLLVPGIFASTSFPRSHPTLQAKAW